MPYFYTGGPEMLAKGERSRRQMDAVSSLASIPGTLIKNVRKADQAQAAGDAAERALEIRLGKQQRTAEQQSAHPDQADPNANADLTQPTVTPADAGGSLTGTLSKYAQMAGGFLGKGLGLTGGVDPKRMARIMALKAQIDRNKDEQGRLSAASGAISRSADPSAIVQSVAPDLGIPKFQPKPDKESKQNLLDVIQKAVQGDPVAQQMVEKYRELHPSPAGPYDTETTSTGVDAQGNPIPSWMPRAVGKKTSTAHVPRGAKPTTLKNGGLVIHGVDLGSPD